MPKRRMTPGYITGLLERWGHKCVVCGRSFRNMACVTAEHVIPRSMRDRMPDVFSNENIAPSHYTCNKLRGDKSIFAAARDVDEQRKKMERLQFLNWLNKPHVNPNRWRLPEMFDTLPQYTEESTNA